jgi:amino acid transporter
MSETRSLGTRLKHVVIGKSRDIHDHRIFHKVSLIALFAWVGLGADGLSSSCYGPEEAYKALGEYRYLSIFIAFAAVATVLIISASYSQIIELFPTGGGGYLVASKLLSPKTGVVSGCALLIDYVLTITISIASGADAVFSMIPQWHAWKFPAQVGGIVLLTLLNLRGVKESVMPLVPVFFMFIITHAIVTAYAILAHGSQLGDVAHQTVSEVQRAQSGLGTAGVLLLLLRAYSTGAGTYTGIEAVSNGLPILREPRVRTGKRTMRYMAISLAATVAGLLLSYLLFHVKPVDGKTLNAVLFEQVTSSWSPHLGFGFVLVALASEAALLFVAAQAGFIDGPRVLANMALDRWFPSRFAVLSDRLVNQNGILLMSGCALIVLWLTRGSVDTLVVLYSINVFITFSLSQLGMVRYWWRTRGSQRGWGRKLLINGLGFVMTASILASMSAVKFHEGGWITLLVTALLVFLALAIKRHYRRTNQMLKRLDDLAKLADIPAAARPNSGSPSDFDRKSKTAVLLVNGYNGLGLHTLMGVVRMFGGIYRNFVFISVGVVDSGNFKGADEIGRLQEHVESEVGKYIALMQRLGYHAEGFTALGTDAVEKIVELAPRVVAKYPNAVFFGGQLVFPRETLLTRFLHNAMVFTVQQKFYYRGYPFLILPIRV